MAVMKVAGMEKRRSTEQRNTVTIGVAATQDSTSEWRELGAQVSIQCDISRSVAAARMTQRSATSDLISYSAVNRPPGSISFLSNGVV